LCAASQSVCNRARFLDPDRNNQHEMLGDVDAVDLNHDDIEAERSDASHSLTRALDSATKCREAADFDTPDPAG
jgi:hypothetical protein